MEEHLMSELPSPLLAATSDECVAALRKEEGWECWTDAELVGAIEDVASRWPKHGAAFSAHAKGQSYRTIGIAVGVHGSTIKAWETKFLRYVWGRLLKAAPSPPLA